MCLRPLKFGLSNRHQETESSMMTALQYFSPMLIIGSIERSEVNALRVFASANVIPMRTRRVFG